MNVEFIKMQIHEYFIKVWNTNFKWFVTFTRVQSVSNRIHVIILQKSKRYVPIAMDHVATAVTSIENYSQRTDLNQKFPSGQQSRKINALLIATDINLFADQSLLFMKYIEYEPGIIEN